jgi:outer membrane protein
VLNVSKSHLVGALVIVALCTGVGKSQNVAQPPARAAVAPALRAGSLALLDVSYIFKNHARFKSMMEEMKADVQRAEDQVKAERKAINDLRAQLGEFQPGTQDYKDLEAVITKRSSDLAVQVQLQKKEFLQREAKIYHTVYQEILQEVSYYAAVNGISMVLKFNGDQADPNQPEEVIRDINKPVIFYAKNLDITPIIRDRLNSRAYTPPANSGGTPPIGTRPGHGVRFK